jgi:HlyD family secretion protein
LFVAVLVALVIYWAAAGVFSTAVAVDAARTTEGPITEFVDEQAVTRLPETYLITMPCAGRIEAITLIEGAPVRKGQVVARIVPSDVRLDVRQALAAVDRLAASVRENAFVEVEQTALAQSLEFVRSMASTVAAAHARVESSKAKEHYAEVTLKRIQGLAEHGAESPDTLDRATLDKVQSTLDNRQDQLVSAAVEAVQAATNLLPSMIREYLQRKALSGNVLEREKLEAEVELEKVRERESRSTMTSPVNGVVLSRPISNERFLAAGTTLLEIGRLEDLEVEADVLSLDVVNVKVGQIVEIYGPAIGRPAARGAVVRVHPAGFSKTSSLGVEQQRVKVIVRFLPGDLARVRGTKDLGVGYRVRVKIVTGRKDKTWTVARSALFRGTSGQWQVFAIRSGRVETHDVRVGMINDQQAEILEGLKPGEQVVLTPETSLTSGQRVWVQRQESASAGKEADVQN